MRPKQICGNTGYTALRSHFDATTSDIWRAAAEQKPNRIVCESKCSLRLSRTNGRTFRVIFETPNIESIEESVVA